MKQIKTSKNGNQNNLTQQIQSAQCATQSSAAQQQQAQKIAESENWCQLRLPSGSLNSRSYHTISFYFNRIYIYGGYELHSGVKDDFFYFDYSTETLGQPQKVYSKNPESQPGPLCRHTANQYKDKLIIYGGKKNAMESSNKLYIYDFIEETWENIKIKSNNQQQPKSNQSSNSNSSNNAQPPYLASHASCIDETNHKMYIFGGFEETLGHINTVYEYNIEQSTWKTLSVQSGSQQPLKRSSHTAVFLNGFIYTFGGQNLNQRFGDLWAFDVDNHVWNEILLPNAPSARNGHSMCVYKDNIIIFGGILGVTREINDLFCYSHEKKEWIRLEDETKYEISPTSQSYSDGDFLNQFNLDDINNNNQNNGQTTRSQNSHSKYQSQQQQQTFKLSEFQEMSNLIILDDLKSPTIQSQSSSQSQSAKQQKHKRKISNFNQIGSPLPIDLNNLPELQNLNSSKSQQNYLYQSKSLNTSQNNDYLMFQQYMNGQKNVTLKQKSQPSCFFAEQMMPSIRLEKRKQLRNSYNSQYIFGGSVSGSAGGTACLAGGLLPSDTLNSSRNTHDLFSPYYKDIQNNNNIHQYLSVKKNNKNKIQLNHSQLQLLHQHQHNQMQQKQQQIEQYQNSSTRKKNQIKIFGADEMIENAASLENNDNINLNQSQSQGNRMDQSRLYQLNNIDLSNLDVSQISNFQSFATRQKSQSVNPLRSKPLKESINTLFDKIKRLSMNPLISKFDKYDQITDLRKKILLREFVDSECSSSPSALSSQFRNHQSIARKHNSNHNSNAVNNTDSRVSSQKYIDTDQNYNKQNEDDKKYYSQQSSRFPILKSPTTDAMRKAIKATECSSKTDRNNNNNNESQQQILKLNNSNMLEQIKSVKIENCRIKNIKPQPRDGHSAIVIADNLVILGGDRHKLSFNDMFECNLKKALLHPQNHKINATQCQSQNNSLPQSPQMTFANHANQLHS